MTAKHHKDANAAPATPVLADEDPEDRYLLFHVAHVAFVCPLLSVKEIVEPLSFRPVPRTQPYFLGMVNLRGQLVGVIDLCQKLGLPSPEHNDTAALLIFEGDTTPMAVLVHRVESVLRIPANAITEEPGVESLVPRAAFLGVAQVNGALIPVTELKHLISEDNLAADAA